MDADLEHAPPQLFEGAKGWGIAFPGSWLRRVRPEPHALSYSPALIHITYIKGASSLILVKKLTSATRCSIASGSQLEEAATLAQGASDIFAYVRLKMGLSRPLLTIAKNSEIAK